MENITKKIRNNYTYTKNVLKQEITNDFNKSDLDLVYLFLGLSSVMSYEDIEMNDNFSERVLDLHFICYSIIARSDYYKSLKRNILLSINVDENQELIDDITDPKMEIPTFLANYSTESFKSLDYFIESSAYDKILSIKCLDETDKTNLRKINPFIDDEFNQYDININLDFIFKHLDLWMKQFDNLEYAINGCHAFLIELDLYRPNEVYEIIKELYDYTNVTEENYAYLLINECLFKSVLNGKYDEYKHNKKGL